MDETPARKDGNWTISLEGQFRFENKPDSKRNSKAGMMMMMMERKTWQHISLWMAHITITGRCYYRAATSSRNVQPE